MLSGLVGKKKHTARAHVLVMAVQADVVKRNEVIHDADFAAAKRELEQSIAPLRRRRLGGIKAAVPGGKKDVAAGVRGRRSTAHPDAAMKSVGSGDENVLLPQRGCIVRKQPAMGRRP